MTAKKKLEFINNILKRVESEHVQGTSLIQLEKMTDTFYLPNSAPLHDLYGKHFNLVDLADRSWYKVNEAHANLSWKSELLLGNLRFGILNCWTAHCQVEFESWKVFRINLARKLLLFDGV